MSPDSVQNTATSEVLETRALNRATLARQLLLDRSPLPPLRAIEHLVGLQAQTATSWYVGLWSRLRDFRPDGVGQALETREIVRLGLIRGTIHLVTARDALALRPVLQPALDRGLRSNYGRSIEGVDAEKLVSAAREVLAEGPLTFDALGKRLAERWEDRDPHALGIAARAWLPMVQVPPRGVWGKRGPAVHIPLDTWLGADVIGGATVDDLMLRYLAAFGPATYADAQTWSGLTGLREVFERLREKLVVFRDQSGQELFDLPDAPRPDPATPAPVRFLYDYDNLLLSHADRTRVISDADRKVLIASMGAYVFGSFLVDGFVRGIWRLDRDGDSVTMAIRLLQPLSTEQRDEVAEEAEALMGFSASEAHHHHIRYEDVD